MPKDLLTSMPVLVTGVIVALISVIAYWRIFKKLGVSGFNGLIPIWNDVRLAKEVSGVWMSLLIFLLYCVSGGMVALAYIRSMTEPSTANRMLLLSSLGVGGVLFLLQGIVQYRLASNFGKGYFFRVMMLLPGISQIFLWILAFSKTAYMAQSNVLELVGTSKKELYARSGIYGQDNYNPEPLVYDGSQDYTGYEPEPVPVTENKHIEKVQEFDDEVDDSYLPDSSRVPTTGLLISEDIPELEEVEDLEETYETQEINSNEEDKGISLEKKVPKQNITWDEVDRGVYGYDDITLENRPLYPFEKKKPEPVESTDPMKLVLEEALFDEEDTELQEAVLNFVKVWKEDKEDRKNRITREVLQKTETKQIEEEPTPTIQGIFSKEPRKPKKVNFDDDFWK